MKYPQGVSLIICTYNGAMLMPETLRHVMDQQLDPSIPWELILIDNASTDGTSDIARSLWKSDIPLRVVSEKQKGLIYARYAGIREARYEYISFIDDDNWIDTHWIEKTYTILKNHTEVGICGGRNLGVYEIPPPDWCKDIEGAFAIGEQGKTTGDVTDTRGHIWGAGMSFRKSAFEDLTEAGYRSVLTGRKGKILTAGEDTEVAFAFRMAGWRLWYSEDLKLQHYIPAGRLDWNYVVRLYIGFGKSHAIFDVYRLVLNNKPFKPWKFYKRLYKEFMEYHNLKRKGEFREHTGNVKYLQYSLRKAKLLQAIKNINKNKKLYNKLRLLKQQVAVGK